MRGRERGVSRRFRKGQGLGKEGHTSGAERPLHSPLAFSVDRRGDEPMSALARARGRERKGAQARTRAGVRLVVGARARRQALAGQVAQRVVGAGVEAVVQVRGRLACGRESMGSAGSASEASGGRENDGGAPLSVWFGIVPTLRAGRRASQCRAEEAAGKQEDGSDALARVVRVGPNGIGTGLEGQRRLRDGKRLKGVRTTGPRACRRIRRGRGCPSSRRPARGR